MGRGPRRNPRKESDMALSTPGSARGPKGYPLIGNLWEAARDPLDFLARCRREYGDFVPLRFGARRVVLLNHPDYIEEVLVTQNRNFIKSPVYRLMRPLIGNGLVTSEGTFWRRQRRLAQPAFHRERIAAYADIMVAYTERLLAGWQDGDVRDVRDVMTQLTLQIVAKALFDADVTAEAAEMGAALTVALEASDAQFRSWLILLPEGIPVPTSLRVRRAVRRADAIVYGIISQRQRSGDDPGDLLSVLIQTHDEDDGSTMTAQQLRDEVMTLLQAGHETTANALTWIWYLLAQHPEVEGRLLAEVRAVLGGRSPTVADIRQLEYTERVVLESLRLYPPFFAMGRQAMEDCAIDGHRVSAGTVVWMSQWVMHRDPRYFEEPEAVRPDRWADGLLGRLPRFAYFPFGGGQRQCIGNAFAMMELVLVVATMAQQLRLSLAPGQQVTPRPAITLRPHQGLRMVVHKR
jgi:cytochrome P450